MSGNKRRHRWRHGPVLVEENITIDSSTRTTSTEEKNHIENTTRKWYGPDDDGITTSPSSASVSANESLSEKIDRVLRRINAWTNETSSTTSNNNNNSNARQHRPVQETSLNKSNPSGYDNIPQGQSSESRTSDKPKSSSFLHSVRQRCCSSARPAPNLFQMRPTGTTHRPYSMTFVEDPLAATGTSRPAASHDYFDYERPASKVRERSSTQASTATRNRDKQSIVYAVCIAIDYEHD